MGLYMKCPGCQGHNPLYEKVCSQCGRSLEHLPREQRVYVIAPGPAAPSKPAAPPAAARAPKKPKAPGKKKA